MNAKNILKLTSILTIIVILLSPPESSRLIIKLLGVIVLIGAIFWYLSQKIK